MSAQSLDHQFDGVAVKSSAHAVLRDGKPLALEPKAFRVLLYLIENRDRAIGKDELIEKVWEGVAVTDNALSRIAAQLRKELGDDARQPRYIQTLPTLGYRFVAELSPAAAPPKPRRQFRWKLLSAAVGLLIVLSAVARWSWPHHTVVAPTLARAVQITTSPGRFLFRAPAPGPRTRSLLESSYTWGMAQHATDQAVHEAARAGLTDKLAEMLAMDPSLIDAKGMDARTPLHCAGTAAVAALLLDHGARIDARDEDHDSTPAQWRIGESPDVARFLLERGAKADIFLAAALGDLALAERLVTEDPGCLAHRIGKPPEFPPLGYKGHGGTIYQWTLRFNSYPHQIALMKRRQPMFDFLYAASDIETRLLVNCVLARRAEAEAIAKEHPEIVPGLPDVDRELVAKYCWETNTNYDAVKLMLDLGFPVAHPERSHGYTPLHNAAWAGSGDLVELLITRGHPVDIRDPAYDATPLGYALHDCLVEKRHPEGEFARVVKALLEAGSPLEGVKYPTGDAAVDEVLRTYI